LGTKIYQPSAGTKQSVQPQPERIERSVVYEMFPENRTKEEKYFVLAYPQSIDETCREKLNAHKKSHQIDKKQT
jgi:hypothetical protein